MISGLFHNWSLAFANGSQAGAESERPMACSSSGMTSSIENSKPVLGPLLQAGPMVRIHLPPVVSQANSQMTRGPGLQKEILEQPYAPPNAKEHKRLRIIGILL